MHAALSTPELLALVLEKATRAEQACMGLTCRYMFDPAMALVWTERGLGELLRLISEDAWQDSRRLEVLNSVASLQSRRLLTESSFSCS